MTSLPVSISFKVGSAMSAASNVRDVIASYRRTQHIVADSTRVFARPDDQPAHPDEENAGEAQGRRFNDHDTYGINEAPDNEGCSSLDEYFVTQLGWDEDLIVPDPMTTAGAGTKQPLSEGSTNLSAMNRVPAMPTRPMDPRKSNLKRVPGMPAFLGTHSGIMMLTSPSPSQAGPSVRPRDTTPLLTKTDSVSFDVLPEQDPSGMPTVIQGEHAQHIPSPALQYRTSSASIAKSARLVKSSPHVGQSTFGQTLFNSVSVLVGIGVLSEPLAFAYSGWLMGTILIVMYGALSCYTAKILARIICADPRLRTYVDIGQKAFGPRATMFISFMFCLEMFAVSVILVTLYADSLHTLIPDYSANTYKIWGFLLLIPTLFLPLSLLSYTSILGILTTVLLIVVILVDGLFKKETPGSFWDPAETTFGVTDTRKLGLAFGLFMAGFSGHVVIPSLARDMIHPSEFDEMINWAFVVATFIYSLIGYAGYLMYGNNVSDEVSMDMLNTPGFNPLLNRAALWTLVLNPLSKFALNTRPLMHSLEIIMGLDEPDKGTLRESRNNLRRVFAAVQRIMVTCASVSVSIYIPEFSIVMAFLGSFLAFCLSIVGPIAAKVKIEGKCNLFDAAVMFLGAVMAIWGTIATFTN